MLRTVDIDIGGRTYPLCLTLWVFGQICDRYGSLRECIQRLDEVAGEFERDGKTGAVKVIRPEDTAALIEEYMWLLEQLLMGGRQTAAAPDGAVSTEFLPDRSNFDMVFCPGDIPYVQSRVLEALRLGQAQEVGTQAPKNNAGAGGGQAPES